MPTLDEIASIYNASPIPCVILRPDAPHFTILAANRAFLKATQKELSALIGKGLFTAFPADTDEAQKGKKNVLKAFETILKFKTPHQVIQYRHDLPGNTSANPDMHYWRIDAYPLLDQQGQVEYLVESLEDITYLKEAEEQTLRSRQRDFDLFNFSPIPMWAYDINNLQILAANKAAKKSYGYTLAEFLNSTVGILWPKEDHQVMLEQITEQITVKVKQELSNHEPVRHITKSGAIIYVDIESGPLPSWGADMRIISALNVTSNKRLHDLESLEKKVLELNSTTDVLLDEVLSYYVNEIESLFPQMHCSVMQVKNGRLYNWVSPSLPRAYVEKIEGIQIGNNVGSCGTAAFLKRRIIVTDIENDPRWENYQQVAVASNLLACWSEPIIDSEENVMATFAIYYDQVKEPEAQELRVIERASSLLKVILESRQYAEALRETTMLMVQAQQLAHFGNWSWDIPKNTVTWSDALFAIYGLKKTEFKATFEGYQELVHPEDKDRVRQIIQQVLHTQSDTEFEERIIRPGGEIRYLKSWAKLKHEKGVPVKMIGACLDITESKKTQERLLASESRLRNLVDAQTNYVIRTDLKGNYTYYNNKYREDFGWLYGENDFLGYSSIDSVSPDSYEHALEVAENCMKHPNKVYQIEINKPAKKGGKRATFWHFIGLTDSHGHPSEIQCIGVDITDRKEAENAIRQHNVQLREIAWAQTHLVRAPLARILGLVDLLNEAKAGAVADKELLEYLHISAKELDRVIKDIIDKSFV